MYLQFLYSCAFIILFYFFAIKTNPKERKRYKLKVSVMLNFLNKHGHTFGSFAKNNKNKKCTLLM